MVKPQDAYIQVTKLCNHRCVFCSQPKEDLSFSLEELKAQIRGYKSKGFKSLVFTGGEPTLLPYILDVFKYGKSLGMVMRMITNGSRIEDKQFAQDLVDSGLDRVIISIHTHDQKMAIKIGRHKNLDKVLQGMRNVIDAGGTLHTNTTVNSINGPHLYEFAKYMTTHFPEVSHFCFNYCDVVGYATANTWIVPKFSQVELQLNKTMHHLYSHGKTFRVERVPLCYMCDFEEFSSETRRHLGQQQYQQLFVRRREVKKWSTKEYVKGDACKACSMEPICAGVKTPYANLHGLGELYPLFKDPQQFVEMGLAD